MYYGPESAAKHVLEVLKTEPESTTRMLLRARQIVENQNVSENDRKALDKRSLLVANDILKRGGFIPRFVDLIFGQDSLKQDVADLRTAMLHYFDITFFDREAENIALQFLTHLGNLIIQMAEEQPKQAA